MVTFAADIHLVEKGFVSMLNKVMIIGHLGADPELRYTQSGSPVASLRIATDESYTDKDGNRVERTEWHRVAVFQRAAENCNQYLRKGSLVYVEGRLRTRTWSDKSGNSRTSTEIISENLQLLGRAPERQETNVRPVQETVRPIQEVPAPGDADDDLPF